MGKGSLLALYQHELVSCIIFVSLNDPEPSFQGETMHRIKASRYIRESQKPVRALPLFSAEDWDKLFLLSESEFPDLVNMGVTRKISVLLFMAVTIIK